jgi:type IV pilus assembly protein PilN
MANINLLPWRERLRDERRKQFFISLGIAFGLGLVIIGIGDRYVNARITNQNARNAYLTEQIALLDQKIAEIRTLQDQKRELSERMAVIQDLEGGRPVIVRLFDELVRTLPDGVYYRTIARTGDTIALSGIADSNNRVSTLMRYLEDSDWFAFSDTGLRQITGGRPTVAADGATQSNSNAFELSVTVTEGTEGDAAEAVTAP